MSAYGLIKATSLAMRSDTITDLCRINNFLSSINRPTIISYGQSVRALENSVAIGLENAITSGLTIGDIPKLERDLSFYRSIISDITEKERSKFYSINKLQTP